MRKLLIGLAAALALTLGTNVPVADAAPDAPAVEQTAATPAGYFYLPSGGSFTGTFHAIDEGQNYSCTFRAYHGNFGNVAFARLDLLGGNCSTWSGTKVQAWGDQSQWCYYFAGTHEDCARPETGVIQAVAVGTLIGSGFTICMGPYIYPPCQTIWFSPIP